MRGASIFIVYETFYSARTLEIPGYSSRSLSHWPTPVSSAGQKYWVMSFQTLAAAETCLETTGETIQAFSEQKRHRGNYVKILYKHSVEHFSACPS